MAGIQSMLGAVVTSPPKSQGRKRAKHSKGEKSVTQPKQQHGELLNMLSPTTPPTDRAMMKDHAKSAMRSATRDWVEGRISTSEHNAIHSRGKHVVSGKRVHEFKGKSGERKRPADHATNGY
jgi:hypothetical protein